MSTHTVADLEFAAKSLRTVVVSITGHIARLEINVPDEPLNVITPALLEDLERILTGLEQEIALGAVKGVVIASGRDSGFVAGADLRQVRSAPSATEAAAAARRFQALCDRIAGLAATTVAEINGPALGGGLELALACDVVIAAESDKSEIGLVEVRVGLLPAGGGTYRLPERVGLMTALPLILSGRRLTPRRARRIGLVDDVVHPAVLRRVSTEAASQLVRRRPRRRQPLQQLLETAALGRRVVYARARRDVLRETKGHYPAPLAALDAVRAGQEHGIDAGHRLEAALFGALAVDPVAHNLIDIFFATTDLKREQSTAYTASAVDVNVIGVVGAGFMGAGIAQAAAAVGIPVHMRDVNADAVARGLGRVHTITNRARRSGRFSAYEASRIINRVTGSTGYDAFKHADLVIEAAFEVLGVKRQIVRELEAIVPAAAVIATNTSSLPIGDVAAEARDPSRVVGMHFFSPVHRMPLVEVVRGKASSDAAVATAVMQAQRLGKTAVVVADGPGFFTTRVLGFMLNEATLCVEAGAEIEEIDRAMVTFGFPVGPLALMDEVGLDVALHVGETLRRAFPGRVATSHLVPRLVEMGHLGRKSGRGFYVYGHRRRPHTSVGREPTSRRSVPTAEEIVERLSLAFVNEAVRCLDEGIVRGPRDGDVAAVLGIGFPPFRGGPFRYVDSLGPAATYERLQRLAQRYGRRFEPAPALERLTRLGQRFYES